MSASTILLIGSGHEPYRRYALKALAARHRVVLLEAAPPTWQRPYLAGHAVADPHDEQAVRAIAWDLAARHRIDGVLTWDEFAAVNAARAAHDLGLPGPDPQAVHACRDKARTRAALEAHGVPSARWTAVAGLEQALRAADRIGYPVVLKPAAAGGSLGVIRADGPSQVREAFSFTARAASQQGPEGTGVLVESYLDGPEVSVEVATADGRHHPVALTRKELGAEPYFEETGHVVTTEPDPDWPAAAQVATAALDAVGITCGISHVELRLTAAGPVVVEINARLGGDLIPHLVHLATGIDLVAAAADLALGRTPDLTRTRNRAAAVGFLYPHTAGILRGLTFAEGVENLPWCERVLPLLPPGTAVAPPPAGGLEARLAQFVVTGATAAQCRRRLNSLTATVHADITPDTTSGAAAA
ncbi:ATP-grasp domain-containing protein [Streptomyces sp. YIM 98790]|uniref:ATP-grasp domain-containing protein n=1 Tax=Streptomyces sp. YIM 98790 TaxID=2689077 RepID=UPI00140DA4BE|nr:ATP-grasp domain-containing protein [Streptomyces sp. YIM 98790]